MSWYLHRGSTFLIYVQIQNAHAFFLLHKALIIALQVRTCVPKALSSKENELLNHVIWILRVPAEDVLVKAYSNFLFTTINIGRTARSRIFVLFFRSFLLSIESNGSVTRAGSSSATLLITKSSTCSIGNETCLQFSLVLVLLVKGAIQDLY